MMAYVSRFGSCRRIFAAGALCDAATAILLTLTDADTAGSLFFLGALSLLIFVVLAMWLIGSRSLAVQPHFVSYLWKLHTARHSAFAAELRRKLLSAGIARADMLLFALAISVGPPLVATMIILGAWPLVTTISLIRATVKDGDLQRYKQFSLMQIFTICIACSGLLLSIASVRSFSLSVELWDLAVCIFLSVLAVAFSRLSVHGLRWAAVIVHTSDIVSQRTETELAVATVAAGSVMLGAPMFIVGLWFTDVAFGDLSKALPVALLIAAGSAAYRLGLVRADALDGVVLVYAAPVVATVVLFLLGHTEDHRPSLFLVAVCLLTVGNVWNYVISSRPKFANR